MKRLKKKQITTIGVALLFSASLVGCGMQTKQIANSKDKTTQTDKKKNENSKESKNKSLNNKVDLKNDKGQAKPVKITKEDVEKQKQAVKKENKKENDKSNNNDSKNSQSVNQKKDNTPVKIEQGNGYSTVKDAEINTVPNSAAIAAEQHVNYDTNGPVEHTNTGADNYKNSPKLTDETKKEMNNQVANQKASNFNPNVDPNANYKPKL